MKEWINNKYHGLIFARTGIGECLNAVYSLRLFFKYSFRNNRLKKKENLKAFLIKQYHIIEKGLSLPNPRENFGIPKIKLLLTKTEQFEKWYGFDIDVSQPVRNCLSDYLKQNPNFDKKDKALKEKIVLLIKQYDVKINFGGTKKYEIEDLKRYTNIDYLKFVQSRSSVRDFKDEKVKMEDIRKAIDIARHTPSVCNRQSWKLHYYDNVELKNALLDLQHGSGGFTKSIQGLFIVTTDIQGFTKMEQNEVFVDGGLISMSLQLALHHLGIGSCGLNTCFPYTREKKVKKLGNIPEHERLIMMIGVGYWKDNFKVAFSQKKEVDEILVKH
ncbi:MAG TPA: nitroreductase family protein [Salinivirgaceae bacterium]|nr:nitroreductase family protein [Salinivirgaceae bacterium]